MAISTTIQNLFIYGYNKHIVIIDKETGIEFSQAYNSHKQGIPSSSLEYNFILFCKKSKELFGDRYSYTDYKGSVKAVTIYDKQLDVIYSQVAQDHLRGHTPIKFKDSIANYDVFLKKSQEHHGDKFEYLEFDWENRQIHLLEKSTGKKFVQSVYEHSNGYLPRGALSVKSVSRPELKLRKEIESLYPDLEVRYNNRFSWLDGKELDIYIPELSLALEYNGSSFHNSNSNLIGFLEKSLKPKEYHVDKFNKCKEQGITLIHIFDFEEYDLKKLIEKFITNDVSIKDNELVCVNAKGKKLEKFSSKARHVYRPIYNFVNKLLPSHSES